MMAAPDIFPSVSRQELRERKLEADGKNTEPKPEEEVLNKEPGVMQNAFYILLI